MKTKQNSGYSIRSLLARFRKSVDSSASHEPLLKPPAGRQFLHTRNAAPAASKPKLTLSKYKRKTMDHHQLMKEKGKVRAEEV